MTKKYPLYLPVLALLMSSCARFAYFQSPFHTNTNSYRTIPMKADSIRSAVYAGGILILGNANDDWRDGVCGFIGTLYRSHNLGYFQCYYGGLLALGNYYVSSTPSGYDYNPYIDDTLINRVNGTKFFGGWGLNGGMNIVIPFAAHEWRIIGVEAAWQQEFGQYLDFREKLPDSAANIISRNRYYMTISINTDLVFKIKNGSMGVKVAHVFSTRSLREIGPNGEPGFVTPGYFSQTLHLTIRRITGFSQLNFGTHAMSWQLGINYRLH